jgi:hypothetical protein
MRGYISALFPDIVSASEAIDRVTATGVERSEINAILSPACVGVAVRSQLSLGTVVGRAMRTKTSRRFRLAAEGEALVAGPLAARIVDDDDFRRSRGMLGTLVDSLAPNAAVLERSLDRGAVIVAVAVPSSQTRSVERALFAASLALPDLEDVVA